MDFAFFHPVATIQVITCSQFLHSHFMEVTTLNFNTNISRGTVYLDGLRILSSRYHDSGHHLFSVLTQSLHGSDNIKLQHECQSRNRLS